MAFHAFLRVNIMVVSNSWPIVTMQIGVVRLGWVRFPISAERDASPCIGAQLCTRSSQSASGGDATFWNACCQINRGIISLKIVRVEDMNGADLLPILRYSLSWATHEHSKTVLLS